MLSIDPPEILCGRLARLVAGGQWKLVRHDPTPLATVLRAALARLPENEELAQFPIWQCWDDVVGSIMARHAQPRRLRRGVLVVEVDGPEWLQELGYLRRDVRDKLNRALGRSVVREVRCVLACEPAR